MSLLHGAALFAAYRIALSFWDLPRDVNFGITLTYVFWGLCLLGGCLAILFQILRPSLAGPVSLLSIAGAGIALFPGFWVPVYPALFAVSALFFGAAWAMTARR